MSGQHAVCFFCCALTIFGARVDDSELSNGSVDSRLTRPVVRERGHRGISEFPHEQGTIAKHHQTSHDGQFVSHIQRESVPYHVDATFPTRQYFPQDIQEYDQQNIVRSYEEEVIPHERREILQENVAPTRRVYRDIIQESEAPFQEHRETFVDTVPWQGHREVIRENVQPVRREVMQEYAAPCQEQREVIQESVAPCQDHREIIRENLAPCAEHREILQDNVAPCQVHREVVQEVAAPCQEHYQVIQKEAPLWQEHHQVIQEIKAPVQEHREIVQEHVAPFRRRHEIVQEHEAPWQERRDIVQEYPLPHQERREIVQGYNEGIQNAGVGSYQGRREFPYQGVRTYRGYH